MANKVKLYSFKYNYSYSNKLVVSLVGLRNGLAQMGDLAGHQLHFCVHYFSVHFN